MRTLHQIILEENGIEALHLFRQWERLQLRDSNFKNHRIFTLRCIHKDLVPVSIKLKTTLRAEKAKKIIRIAEKQVLQVGIKLINCILVNSAKQSQLCRSKLASILSTTNYRKCQEFIEKVGELRFNKVKNRQAIKFNNLVCKKEGNISWETLQSTRVTASSSQAGRQALTFPRTALLPRKPAQSSLIAIPPGKAFPRREGTPSQLTV